MKVFKFQCIKDKQVLEVTIPEVLDASYGMYVWPCAAVLSQYIWFNRNDLLTSKHVLEIGAGTSLPSIVTVKCANAASITITDDVYQSNCLNNCELSCKANNILSQRIGDSKSETNVFIMGLTWGEMTNILNLGKDGFPPLPDVILGSDCFFDEQVYDSLLFTINYFLRKKDETQKKENRSSPYFLCAYQERSHNGLLQSYLNFWDLQYEIIPLDEFKADSNSIAESNLPGNHQIFLLKISLKQSHDMF